MKVRVGQNTVRTLVLSVVCFFFLLTGLGAQEYAPTLTGASVNLGYTYDPSDGTCFAQASLFRVWDYDRIWKHKAPEMLRFKVEGSFGAARWDGSHCRIITSVNIFAMLYLKRFFTSSFRPFVEAGIGGIYTDYKVTGQDYRINFNPQAGIGLEFDTNNNATWFTTLRLHHLSNANIGETNRGQNSVVLLIGQYF